MTFPWDPPPFPVVIETPQPPAVADVVASLQADIRYMVSHTAVLVHSSHAALQMLVNTPRGQIIPRGECRFSDGSTLEFQDIGMPQVNVSEMTVKELIQRVYETAAGLGLEIAP